MPGKNKFLFKDGTCLTFLRSVIVSYLNLSVTNLMSTILQALSFSMYTRPSFHTLCVVNHPFNGVIWNEHPESSTQSWVSLLPSAWIEFSEIVKASEYTNGTYSTTDASALGSSCCFSFYFFWFCFFFRKKQSCLRCPFLWQNVHSSFDLFFNFMYSFELLLLFPFENKPSPFVWSLFYELSSILLFLLLK